MLSILGIRYGAGRHTAALTMPMLITGQEIGFISRLIYQAILCITKVGICAFYLRVFQDRRSKILIYAMIAAMVLYTVPLELVTIFSCKPVKGYWELTKPRKCINPVPSIFAVAILNISSDALLIVFVVPRVGMTLNKERSLSL